MPSVPAGRVHDKPGDAARWRTENKHDIPAPIIPNVSVCFVFVFFFLAKGKAT